jgi:hypothetical protein
MNIVWKKAAVALLSVSTISVAGIGALHTKAGRPVLAKLAPSFARMGFKMAGCPVGAAVTPAEAEVARLRAVEKTRGATASPARPALGFALDTTTLADVRAWSVKNGVSCTESRKGTLVQCPSVSPSALGRTDAETTVDDLSLGFTPAGRLVAVTTFRSHRRPEDAARAIGSIGVALEKDLGAATVKGTPTASYLGEGTLRTVTLEYRYKDYLVDVSAVSFDASGVLVREQYSSGALSSEG